MANTLKIVIVMGLLSCASIAAAENTNPRCWVDHRGYLCCPWRGATSCDPATGPD